MCVKHSDQYFPFPEFQCEVAGADSLGYEHLQVLFGVIAVGIGWSAILGLCELGGSLRKRKGLSYKPKSGDKSKKRRASF